MRRALILSLASSSLLACTLPRGKPIPKPPSVLLSNAVTFEDVRPAVDQMLSRIEALDTGGGWPPGTAKRDGRALIRVAPILDRGCVRQTDPIGLRNDLINALTRQGRVDLVSDDAQETGPESVNAPRSYGAPQKRRRERRRTVVTLALKGVLAGNRFRLRLIDLRTDAVLADTSATIPTAVPTGS